MTGIRHALAILMVLPALFLTTLSADASDKEKYQELVKAVIADVVKNNTADVDKLIAKLDEATNIGISMARGIAEKDEKGKKLLDFLISNIDKVKAADLEEIEHDWHHGNAFKKAGIQHDSFDHYGAVIGAKDAVVHPLTAIVALKQFKKDGNKDLLEQAQAELEEILGQLKYIQ